MVIFLPTIPYIHRIYLYMYGSGQPYEYCWLAGCLKSGPHVLHVGLQLWERNVTRVGQSRTCTHRVWLYICKVGQNRINTPYMVVYLVISLPKIPYIHRIYIHICGSGQPYIYGEFPANNTVYAPYIYGSGQPYTLHTSKTKQPSSLSQVTG